MITIYRARSIITLNGYRPRATAVAVRDGRILCVGTVDECASWGEHFIDDTFRDLVLMPGMVEAHGHTAEAANLNLPYVGFYDIPLPDGGRAAGVTSYEQLIEALRVADAALPPGQVLLANGFDPIFFADQPRLSTEHLDRVSLDRPIFVRHASGHLATVNTAMLKAEGITVDSAPGVVAGPDGQPSGELQEAPAMTLAKSAVAALLAVSNNPTAVTDYARLCRNAGVTTTSELLGTFILLPDTLATWQSQVEAPDFPVRISVYNLPGIPGKPADYAAAAEAALALRSAATDKLRIGGIKLVGDGSLQGWTACCGTPAYFTGDDHGLFQFTQDDLDLAVRTFHEAGLQIYFHANGDAAVEMLINSVDRAMRNYAWLDHRHTAQHAQTATASQYRRMATLGIAANLFSNHIWYWGDQHVELVKGPEIVERMWAARSAMEAGVSVTYHSDSGVTPTGQLHTAWCAVNRLTPKGRTLGEAEKVTVEQALRAVTIEAAYQLRMDAEIGTIEAGKLADFAVLQDDPFEVEPEALRDVRVWGTVVGGQIFEAERG